MFKKLQWNAIIYNAHNAYNEKGVLIIGVPPQFRCVHNMGGVSTMWDSTVLGGIHQKSRSCSRSTKRAENRTMTNGHGSWTRACLAN